MAKSDNWQTPPNLAAVLQAEFKFDVEVCAAEGNRAIPKIPYMGLDNGMDALKVDWGNPGDMCYCNPPYSMLKPFIMRAMDQYKKGREIVMLVPAYTDTQVWWDVVSVACDVRFLKGRLRFWDQGKPGKDTARFPSALLVFKSNYGAYKGGVKGYTFWDWKDALDNPLKSV